MPAQRTAGEFRVAAPHLPQTPVTVLRPQRHVRLVACHRSQPRARDARPVALEPTPVNQTAEHRPVLVTLSLLSPHQIGQRQHIDFYTLGLNHRAPVPQNLKRLHVTQDRHHVDAKSGNACGEASEMDGKTALQISQFKFGNSDHFGFEFGQGTPQTQQVGRVGKHQQVQIPAEFGRAVVHARLATHEHSSHAIPSHRRKGSEGRVQGQVSLPAQGMFPKASTMRHHVRRESCGTIRPILPLPDLRHESVPPFVPHTASEIEGSGKSVATSEGAIISPPSKPRTRTA